MSSITTKLNDECCNNFIDYNEFLCAELTAMYIEDLSDNGPSLDVVFA